MRTEVHATASPRAIAQIEAEAWVVLEMHFLSRPYLCDEARTRLGECLETLCEDGICDARELKDRACRKVQIMYGPAPALNDDTAPVTSYVA